VRFGYFGSKEYFVKNLGAVKDYRNARQLLLDAESAMLKTIASEKWRMRQAVDRAARERDDAVDEARLKGVVLEQVLKEKEVRVPVHAAATCRARVGTSTTCDCAHVTRPRLCKGVICVDVLALVCRRVCVLPQRCLEETELARMMAEDVQSVQRAIANIERIAASREEYIRRESKVELDSQKKLLAGAEAELAALRVRRHSRPETVASCGSIQWVYRVFTRGRAHVLACVSVVVLIDAVDAMLCDCL
jgi:hypothetical protein